MFGRLFFTSQSHFCSCISYVVFCILYFQLGRSRCDQMQPAFRACSLATPWAASYFILPVYFIFSLFLYFICIFFISMFLFQFFICIFVFIYILYLNVYLYSCYSYLHSCYSYLYFCNLYLYLMCACKPLGNLLLHLPALII